MAGVFGQGNPLLDISSNVDQAFLEKYGLKNSDQILAEEKHFPIYEELAGRPDVVYVPGGATLNTVRVAQWAGRGNVKAAYTGSIGKDKFGDVLKSTAEKSGVTMNVMVDESTPTGTCAVCVIDKDRSLVANLAAANNFKGTHVDTPEVQASMQASNVFYSAGFHLTVPENGMKTVAEHAAAAGKTYTINLSAPFICQFFGTQLHEMIPYCDFVFGNETEFAAYGEANTVESKDLTEIAKVIAGLEKKNADKPRYAVVTQGKDATLIVGKDGLKVKVDVPEVEASKIVDTNGAGDSFVGGFLAMIAQGKSLEEACQAGHACAGFMIQVSGCQPSGDAPC